MSNEKESSSQGVALDMNKRFKTAGKFRELLAARCGSPQPQGVPKETSSTASTLDNSIDPKQQENEEGENDRVKDEKQYSGEKQADGEEREDEEDIDVRLARIIELPSDADDYDEEGREWGRFEIHNCPSRQIVQDGYWRFTMLCMEFLKVRSNITIIELRPMKVANEFDWSIHSELPAARCGTPQPQQVPKETPSTASTLANSEQRTASSSPMQNKEKVKNESMLNKICISKQRTKFCGHDH
ncbi:hypothetical protein Cgig2_021809 [Carnegiea gigantea]|uniref:Uncharacterized protein n=1 Tax=Carnegiea gigantea TaxID=171969 RepID=A0A9Q1QG99_9CARY|nr:hypothetical protein Cgig2_021809 [Carnegiea gigantea]